jgi:hypothetical protein
MGNTRASQSLPHLPGDSLAIPQEIPQEIRRAIPLVHPDDDPTRRIAVNDGMNRERRDGAFRPPYRGAQPRGKR